MDCMVERFAPASTSTIKTFSMLLYPPLVERLRSNTGSCALAFDRKENCVPYEGRVVTRFPPAVNRVFGREDTLD
jgi:hypothetical protein